MQSELEQKTKAPVRKKHRGWRILRRAGAMFAYAGVHLREALFSNLAVIIKEGRLFAGITLFFAGILGFESGRYCDGNSAEYLSCTRPATYYYFDGVNISLVILGAFLVTLWALSRGRLRGAV